MSSTSEASPLARSGIDVGSILRLLAIALGIMATVLIAVDDLGSPLARFSSKSLMVFANL